MQRSELSLARKERGKAKGVWVKVTGKARTGSYARRRHGWRWRGVLKGNIGEREVASCEDWRVVLTSATAS